MGKYRDHRQPRGDRFDGDQGPESFEPSYFQRRTEATGASPLAHPPILTGNSPPLDAEVLWFNAEKGFGFVRMSDGADVFLHMSKLQAAGQNDLPAGAVIRVRTEVGNKGPQVVEVVSVSVDGAVPAIAALEPAVAPEPQEQECVGVVKRYDAIKGFGFISVESGGEDVFVHATALTRSGLTKLDTGQNVAVRYGRGLKGLEVRSIQLC